MYEYKLTIMDKKHANGVHGNVKCSCCKNLFCTEGGLRQHCRITNSQMNFNTQPAEPKPLSKSENIAETSMYKWEEYKNKQCEENVSYIYEKIVY